MYIPSFGIAPDIASWDERYWRTRSPADARRIAKDRNEAARKSRETADRDHLRHLEDLAEQGRRAKGGRSVTLPLLVCPLKETSRILQSQRASRREASTRRAPAPPKVKPPAARKPIAASSCSRPSTSVSPPSLAHAVYFGGPVPASPRNERVEIYANANTASDRAYGIVRGADALRASKGGMR